MSPTRAESGAGIGSDRSQYTDQINPCQYMTYMGAIANGGSAAEPYLVKEVTYGDSVKYKASTSSTGRLLDSTTADRLADMMHNAVVNVYGEWNFAGLYAGGKSGTAENGGGRLPTLSFAGFLQDSDYPLAFIVVVEEGRRRRVGLHADPQSGAQRLCGRYGCRLRKKLRRMGKFLSCGFFIHFRSSGGTAHRGA